MAKTKKAEAINAAKYAEHLRIRELQSRVKAACNKVPASVVNGSHQVAVQWKADAHEIFSGALVQNDPAKSKSLHELQDQTAKLEAMLVRLVLA